MYAYRPIHAKLRIMNGIIWNWSSKIDTTTAEKGRLCCCTFLTAFQVMTMRWLQPLVLAFLPGGVVKDKAIICGAGKRISCPKQDGTIFKWPGLQNSSYFAVEGEAVLIIILYQSLSYNIMTQTMVFGPLEPVFWLRADLDRAGRTSMPAT